MEIQISSKEFNLKLKQEKYFNALLIQVIKDFNDESFSESIRSLNLDQLDIFFELVANFLCKKYLHTTSDFFQLLYLIDVPEKLIAPIFQGTTVNWKELAYLISKREFLKIILREKYSQA